MHKMKFNTVIKNSAFFIIILSSALYVHGVTFYSGFLRYWGLDESLFKLSFERTLVEGYYAFMTLGATAIIKIVTVCILVFVGANLIVFMEIIINEKKKPPFLYNFLKKLKITSIEDNDAKPHPILNVLAIGVFISCGVLVAILVLAILGASSETQGFKSAEKKHQIMISAKYKNRFSEQVSFNFDNKYQLTKGNIITCSDIHCAIYDENKVHVVRISDIQNITSKYKK